MVGRARACRDGEGSKRRSRVEVRAVSVRVGREAMAGRKGVAVGLRVDSVMVERPGGLAGVVVGSCWACVCFGWRND
jgi:hypothetical protein